VAIRERSGFPGFVPGDSGGGRAGFAPASLLRIDARAPITAPSELSNRGVAQARRRELLESFDGYCCGGGAVVASAGGVCAGTT